MYYLTEEFKMLVIKLFCLPIVDSVHFEELMMTFYWTNICPGLQGEPTSQSWRKSALNIHWKVWCWSWNSNTLATWWEEPTHWKRYWCWEKLKTEEEGGDRGWDGWMASLTWWTWVWVGSGSWRWTGKPGVLQFMGSPRTGQDWTTELNWTEYM